MKILASALLAMAFALLGSMAAAQSEYRVQPGDAISVEVLEDNTLNRTLVVLPDGRITFPFAGSLQVAGRSAGQIQTDIRTAIQANFTTPPTVFVTVQPSQNSFSSSSAFGADTISIYFLGEVNRPGVVELEPGTTLLQAMAVSGGLTRFAAVKRIQLRRTNKSTGVQNVVTLNYRALANGTASNVIELKDGDVILVPERRLFE
jgi:polysaccharide export outer membrane protein